MGSGTSILTQTSSSFTFRNLASNRTYLQEDDFSASQHREDPHIMRSEERRVGKEC